MAAKIVVRGTREQVMDALVAHKLVPALGGESPVINPDGYQHPSVMLAVCKAHPLDWVFMFDILKNWVKEENSSLLDY